MSKKIEYQEGDLIGTCFFVKEVDTHISPSGNRYRTALYQCPLCGKEFKAMIGNVKSGRQVSCGCHQKQMRLKHGLHATREYHLWEAIVNRCCNPNDKNYHHYGGRGIKICDEWRNSPSSFCYYVKKLENYSKRGMELDRKKNDEGYKPGNVRWVDRHTQVANARMQKSNTSGFVGVRIKRGRFGARITVYGDEINLGWYGSSHDAVNARNNYIIKHKLWEYPIQAVPDYLIQ